MSHYASNDTVQEVAKPAVRPLLDLANRVEAAEAADPGLRDEVAVAVGFCLHKSTTYSACQDDTGHTCDDCGANIWGRRSRNGKNQALYGSIPEFLTSLDAAIMMLPEGCEWGVFGDGLSWVRIHQSTGFQGNAATPSLSLTAASLRARAALEESGTRQFLEATDDEVSFNPTAPGFARGGITDETE